MLGQRQPHRCGAEEVTVCPGCINLSILNCRANGLGLLHRLFGFCTIAVPVGRSAALVLWVLHHCSAVGCVCCMQCVCRTRCGSDLWVLHRCKANGVCLLHPVCLWDICGSALRVLHHCKANGVGLLHWPLIFCSTATAVGCVCCTQCGCRTPVGRSFGCCTIAKPVGWVCCIDPLGFAPLHSQ